MVSLANLLLMTTKPAPTSGQTKQYIYRTDTTANLVSDITAISDNEFLVLERDGEFPQANNPGSSFKKIYKIKYPGCQRCIDDGRDQHCKWHTHQWKNFGNSYQRS